MQSFIFTSNDPYSVPNSYDHRQLQPGFHISMDWPLSPLQHPYQPLTDTVLEQAHATALDPLERLPQPYEPHVPRTLSAVDWSYPLPQASQFHIPASHSSTEQHQSSIYIQHQEHAQPQPMTLTRQTCPSPRLIASYRHSDQTFVHGDAGAQSFGPWMNHHGHIPSLIQPCEDKSISLAAYCPQRPFSPPQQSFWDVGSLSSNDEQWRTYSIDCVDPRAYLTTPRYDPAAAAISNPGLHLHLRTKSNSSMDDFSARSNCSSCDELLFGTTSPESEPARDPLGQDTVQESDLIVHHAVEKFTPPDSSLTLPRKAILDQIVPATRKQSTIKTKAMLDTKTISSGKKLSLIHISEPTRPY